MDYLCPSCGLARSEDEMSGTDDGALCRTCAQALEAYVDRKTYLSNPDYYDLLASYDRRFWIDGGNE